MKKLFVFLVLAVAMIGSAMAQSNAPAPTLAARNNPGYCEIYIPYTWTCCGPGGNATVLFTWDDGPEFGIGYYERAGETVPLRTPAHGGTILQTKACARSTGTIQENCETVSGYQGYFSIAPPQCGSDWSCDCKNLPNGTLACKWVEPPIVN